MGSALSEKEVTVLQPHLQGFEAASLASVIWDAINQVGVDDEQEKMGIHFETGDTPAAIFWDETGPQHLPRKAFLQVMEMVAERTIESSYDLEKSKALGAVVSKLKLALVYLQREIQSMKGEEGGYSYRKHLESGASVTSAGDGIEEIRSHKISRSFAEPEEGSHAHMLAHRQSGKGMEGVVERLPELKRRYQFLLEDHRD